MPRYAVALPDGSTLQFDLEHEATNEAVAEFVSRKLRDGADPSVPEDWVEDSSFLRAPADLAANVAAEGTRIAGAFADAAQPDPIALSSEPDSARSRLQLFGRGLSKLPSGGIPALVGNVVETVAEAPDRARDLVQGAERYVDNKVDYILNETRSQAERDAVHKRLTGEDSPLKKYDESRAADRAREDARRAAIGEPSLEQERRQQIGTKAQDVANVISEGIKEHLVSDEGRAEGQGYTQNVASQTGLRDTVSAFFDAPISNLQALLPSVAASVGGPLAFGRLVGAANIAKGATAIEAGAAASNAAVASGVATQALLDADEVAESIMMTPEKDASNLAGYDELRKTLNHEQALAELATRGYMTTLTGVTALTGATAGLSQTLGLNVVEDLLKGAAPSRRILGALAGRPVAQRFASGGVSAAAEGVGEAGDSGGEKFAQNIGEVAAGAREIGKAGEGVLAASAIGTFAASPLGFAAGARKRPATPGEQQADRIISAAAAKVAAEPAPVAPDVAPKVATLPVARPVAAAPVQEAAPVVAPTVEDRIAELSVTANSGVMSAKAKQALAREHKKLVEGINKGAYGIDGTPSKDAAIKRRAEITVKLEKARAAEAAQNEIARLVSTGGADAAMRADLEASVTGMLNRATKPPQALAQPVQNQEPVASTESTATGVTGTAAGGEQIQQQSPVEDVQESVPSEGRRSIVDPNMQPRDRGRTASTVQLLGMVNNLDPQQLSHSRDPGTGAPMVEMRRDIGIPESDMGRTDIVTFANGQKVEVRYAVVEADSIEASHDVYGNVNPAYQDADLQALNNGRAEALKEAARRGKLAGYVKGIVSDEGLHRVSAAAFSGKSAPILIRLFKPVTGMSNIGAESNVSPGLVMSPSEQAHSDARILPDLSTVEIDEAGGISVGRNTPFFRAFFASVGKNEAAQLQSAGGRINSVGLGRIRNALLARAYNNDELVSASSEGIDESSKNIINAMVQAAPAMAKIDKDGPLGAVPEQIALAFNAIREAGRNGISPDNVAAQGDMLGRSEATQLAMEFFAQHRRSSKRIASELNEIARVIADSQIQNTTQDIFGEDTTPEVSEVFERARKTAIGGKDEARSDQESDGNAFESGNDSGEQAGRGRATADNATRANEEADTDDSQRSAEEEQLGLFAAPTNKERIAALAKDKDAKRNGLGRDLVRPEQGDGDLLAGDRPEQARIDEPQAKKKSGDVVERILERFGGSVLAQSIKSNFKRLGGSRIIGLKAKTAEDMAAINAVYRDPEIETMRYQFVAPDGTVVHESAVSSRAVNSVNVFPESSDNDYVAKLLLKVRETHPGSKLWMVHNHPSGVPNPSRGDTLATEAVARSLERNGIRDGFAGHIVLDHDSYGSLTVTGGVASSSVQKLPSAAGKADPLREPRGEHKGVLGLRISEVIGAADGSIGIMADISKIADVARANGDDTAAFIVTGVHDNITTVFTAPLNQANGKRALAALARVVRISGGLKVSVVASDATLDANKAVIEGIKKAGMLRVAVDHSGELSFDGTSDRGNRSRSASRETVNTVEKVPEAKQVPKATPRTYDLFAEDNPDDTLDVLSDDDEGGIFERVKVVKNAAVGKAKDIIKWYTTHHLDKYIELKHAQERVSALLGRLVPEWADAWRHENRIHGIAGDQRAEAERKFLKPMIEAITRVGKTEDDFGRFMWWRHAPEREKFMSERYGKYELRLLDKITDTWFVASSAGTREIMDERAEIARAAGFETDVKENKDIEDRKSGEYAGISPEAAKKAIDQLPKDVRDAFEEAALIADTMRRFTLDALLESGQISKERHAGLLKQYKHYAPLRGLPGEEDDSSSSNVSTGSGLQAQRAPLGKPATGRKSEPKHVFQHMVRDMENAIVGRQKQAFMRTLINLIALDPQKAVGTIRPMERVPAWVGGVITYKWRRSTSEDQVVYMHEGKPVAIELASKQLADAVRNVGEDKIGALLRATGTVTRFLAAVKTSLSPFFPIVNTPRDLELGFAYLNAKHPKLVKVFGATYLKTYSVLWNRTRVDRKAKAGDPLVTKYEREFSENGGRTSTIFVSDISGVRKELSSIVRKYSKDPSLSGVKRVMAATMRAVEAVNEVTETSTRLAAYIAARENGMSIVEAVDIAKNITVNFNRSGSSSKHVGALYVFWNAANQGAVTIGSLMKSKRFRRTMYGLAATSYGMALAQMIAMGDDDDGESLYEKRVGNNANKRAIPVVWDQEAGKHFDIPMFYGANIFSYLGYQAARVTYDTMRGRRVDTVDLALTTAGSVIDSMSPIQTDAGLLAAMPEPVRIIYQTLANDNGRGGKLAYGVNPYELDQTHPRWQDTLSTESPIYKWIARALNESTTVRDGDYYAGLVNPTGEQTGYLIEEVTGGPGRFVAASASLALDLMGGVNPDGPEDIPLLGVLFKGRDPGKETGKVFGDRSKEYNSAVAKYVKAVANNDTKMQTKLLDEEPWLKNADKKAGTRAGKILQRGTVMETFRDTKSRIRDLRDEQKAIRDDDSMSRRDVAIELRRIDKLIEAEQKKFVAAMNRARGYDIGDGAKPTPRRR